MRAQREGVCVNCNFCLWKWHVGLRPRRRQEWPAPLACANSYSKDLPIRISVRYRGTVKAQIYRTEAEQTWELLGHCQPERLTLDQRSWIQDQRLRDNDAYKRYNHR